MSASRCQAATQSTAIVTSPCSATASRAGRGAFARSPSVGKVVTDTTVGATDPMTAGASQVGPVQTATSA